MHRPAAVIFDLDGCLVDSEPLAIHAIVQEMLEIGITNVTTEEIRERFLGVPMHVMCKEVAARSGRTCPDDFVDRVEARLAVDYRKKLQPIDGVIEALAALQKEGVPMAIATGASIRRMNDTLLVGGLDTWFDGVAFSSDQVERGKPAPDLFLHAARELGVPPIACIVIEDSPHGVEGAIAAGMRAVGFIGGSHLEGRREEHAALLRSKGAVMVTGAMTDVIELCLAS